MFLLVLYSTFANSYNDRCSYSELNSKIISDYQFSSCSSDISGSLTIPDIVEIIGKYAFEDAYKITSLYIPKSVRIIGESAFRGCNSLSGSLEIPDSVEYIGNNAFYNCFGFTGTLKISNFIREINYNCFYNCYGFTGSLRIPDPESNYKKHYNLFFENKYSTNN